MRIEGQHYPASSPHLEAPMLKLRGIVGNLPGGVSKLTLANMFNEQWEILEARSWKRGSSMTRRVGCQRGLVLSHMPLMKDLRMRHRILIALLVHNLICPSHLPIQFLLRFIYYITKKSFI